MGTIPPKVEKLANALHHCIVENDPDNELEMGEIMHALLVVIGQMVGFHSQLEPDVETRDRWRREAVDRIERAVSAYQDHPEWLPRWMRRALSERDERPTH